MPYLFLMLGTPGSGKSFVSAWLGPRQQALHARSDDLRLHLFGQNRLELHQKARYRKPVVGALRYMVEQTLAAGHSIILDANMSNRREGRDLWRKIAADRGAVVIVIYVKAPLDITRQRVVDRAESGGHQYFELDFVERIAKSIQPPTPPELAITLDGLQTSAEQQVDFDRQFANIKESLERVHD